MKNFTQIEFKDIDENREYIKIINEVINRCFKEEHLENTNLYISIILTTPNNIRKINKEYRDIDKETDVLSFPMFEKGELIEAINSSNEVKYVLGDVIISIERVKEQAKEYNHSFKRELAYMIVHGFYHLMGYDHLEEADKIKMRLKEEKILQELNITRI